MILKPIKGVEKMELVGQSVVEASRRYERASAWKTKFAFWPVHVANKEDGSPLKIWFRLYEKKEDLHEWGWGKWKTRYKGYPELEHTLVGSYD